MRRLRPTAPILLIACFLSLGSGALRFAHDAHHAHEDELVAAVHAADGAAHGHRHDHHPPHHDETNCEVHALLNAPLLAGTGVPALVLAGLLVAFVTLLPEQPARLRLPSRIDCRGPPALRR